MNELENKSSLTYEEAVQLYGEPPADIPKVDTEHSEETEVGDE